MWHVIFLIMVNPADGKVAPEWVSQTHRQVVNGDIVHWGTGDGQTSEVALFKARHMAIGTLMEECGGLANKEIIPRKQHIESTPDGYRAYSLVSLDWDSCNQAKEPVAKQHPELFENQKTKEGQALYHQLLGGKAGVNDPSERTSEVEKRIKEFLLQEADIRTDELGILKEQIHRLEMAVRQNQNPAPVIPIKLPSMTSQKAQCQAEYQNMMGNLTMQAADYNGNMAAPEMSREFGRAMQKKNICGRLE